MKNLYYAFALVLVFASCDELKNLADVTIDADFTADLPITSSAAAKGDVGADEVQFPLGGSYTLRADDNDEVADYLDKLKEVSLTGYTMKPVGLSAQNVIGSLVIKINDVVMFDGSDIVSTSVFTDADISEAAINEFTSSMLKDKKVTFTASGYSSMPLVITLSQLFETEITANPLN